MKVCRFFTILSILLALALAYYLYEPLPEEATTERGKLRVFAAIIKLLDLVCSTGSFLGFGTYVDIQRAVFKGAVYLNRYSTKIKTIDATFDSVPVRIYRPFSAPEKDAPAIVYFHAGGYTFGRIDDFDEMCELMANESDAVVVSVDYRRSPEYIFPTAHDDSLRAAKYFLKNAQKFQIDPQRVALLGDSAGGNLVASTSQQLRDQNFKQMPKLQVLVYPHLQMLDFRLPSYQANYILLNPKLLVSYFLLYMTGKTENLDDIGVGNHISSAIRQKYSKILDHKIILKDYPFDHYAAPKYPTDFESKYPEIQKMAVDPILSPLIAENLSGLPETYVATFQMDALHDDGIWFAHRLKNAGVKVTLMNYKDGYHGVFLPLFDKYRKDTMKFVKERI